MRDRIDVSGLIATGSISLAPDDWKILRRVSEITGMPRSWVVRRMIERFDWDAFLEEAQAIAKLNNSYSE